MAYLQIKQARPVEYTTNVLDPSMSMEDAVTILDGYYKSWEKNTKDAPMIPGIKI